MKTPFSTLRKLIESFHFSERPSTARFVAPKSKRAKKFPPKVILPSWCVYLEIASPKSWDRKKGLNTGSTIFIRHYMFALLDFQAILF